MAFVLSSVSGNLISAASAGYSPTNGGDVSAIASAYAASAASGKLDSSAQVVTSTATQLYAGTAYLTSVNGAPVSASRAGNAANASLANSAWYDGTGRFISALPDSATVSAIASSYATGKQDTLAFSYDGDKISAINGSALAGQGGVTGDYVEKSSMDVTIGSNITAGSTAFAQGSANSSIGRSFAQGDRNTAGFFSFAQGGVNNVSGTSFAQGSANFANGTAFAQGIGNTAVRNSFAQGLENTARYVSFAQGVRNSAINTATVFGMYNLHGDGSTSTGNSAAFVIGDGTAANARHDLMRVTKDGEITMYSSTADTVGTGIMSSLRTISAAAAGGVDSATVSGIASAYAQSAASSKLDTSAFNSGDFYLTSNPSGFITGVDLTPYALSSDVSGTVDLVSTQSANWGLTLSAGPGVKVEKVGNTLVASIAGPLHRQETLAGYWNGSAVYQQFISGTATSNGTANFSIPAEIVGTGIVNKWIDPSNSFIYYNTTSNALPISWCLGANRYGSVGFVGSLIQSRCVDTAPTTITAYIALKYMKE